MNWQQWNPLDHAPIGDPVAVNTGGYIFRGTFYRRPNDDLYCVGPYGKIFELDEIKTWSWSAVEPAAETDRRVLAERLRERIAAELQAIDQAT